MRRSGKRSGVRMRRNCDDSHEPALQLCVVIRPRIARKVTVSAGGAIDLGLEMEELIQRGWPLPQRAGTSVIDGESGIDRLQHKSIADREPLIRRLGAELRVRVGSGS